MKTTKTKKTSAVSSSNNSSNKNGAKLYLTHSATTPPEQPESKYRAGDMDMLERNAEKPLPAAFEQFDRTCKAVHSFVGWPYAIV